MGITVYSKNFLIQVQFSSLLCKNENLCRIKTAKKHDSTNQLKTFLKMQEHKNFVFHNMFWIDLPFFVTKNNSIVFMVLQFLILLNRHTLRFHSLCIKEFVTFCIQETEESLKHHPKSIGYELKWHIIIYY